MHIKPKKTRTAKVFGQVWGAVTQRQPLKLNSASNGILIRGDGFQFSDPLHDYIGIFQSVAGNRANNPATFRNFFEWYTALFESQYLKNPAMAAALAGSTKIPSCRASHIWAPRISSSVTTSTAPRDSAMAARACFQLAGLPIRMADAIVSGCSMIRL